MKKVYALLVGGALLALANTAYAGQPVQLSDSQMDRVTAGITTIANGASVTFGELFSVTVAMTSTNADTVTHFGVAQAYSQGVAASLLSQAASVSGAESFVTLP